MPAISENRAGYEDLLKNTSCKCDENQWFLIRIVLKPELDIITKHFNSLASIQNDKIDRSKFRDLLADSFDINDSLLMDRSMIY